MNRLLIIINDYALFENKINARVSVCRNVYFDYSVAPTHMWERHI